MAETRTTKSLSKIPFAEVDIPEEVAEDCKQILRSGKVTNGKYVRELEERVAHISKTKHAIATNSCTNGLILSAQYLFHRDNVIGVQAYSWPSTWHCAEGYDKVWLDVDPRTWLVSHTSDGCDGYILTDTFGSKANLETELPTLIDAAHSLGIPHNPKYDASVYSMSPAKTFTSVEGGVIVTDNQNMASWLKNKAHWAGRMSEVNARVGLYYLDNYKAILKGKQYIASMYKEHLPFLQFQEIPDDTTHNVIGALAPYKIVRDKLISHLKEELDLRIRYTPASPKKTSLDLHERNLCIPSWVGSPTKKIVNLLQEAYENI